MFEQKTWNKISFQGIKKKEGYCDGNIDIRGCQY